MSLLNIHPSNIENINIARRPTNWQPPIPSIIPSSREEALQAETDNEDDIKVFTDGSGAEGQIGAAAVLFHGFREPKIARKYLGPITKHTVFEGECVAHLLAINLLRQVTQRYDGASIWTDNHATIRSISNRKPTPGSYIADETIKELSNLRRHFPHSITSLTIQWIPGHENNKGNELADHHAKLAAEGPQNNANSNFSILRKALPASKSALQKHFRSEEITRLTEIFRSSLIFPKVARYDPSLPASRFWKKMTDRYHRRHLSILTQLRSGHVPLNAYLFRFKLIPSPLCNNCELREPETVTHYLRYCPSLAGPRRALQCHIGPETNIGISLLGDDKHRDALLHFIHSTNRFAESHGNLMPPPPPRDET